MGKFIILQMSYNAHGAVVFNNKNSLYHSGREYINVLNYGKTSK